MENMTKLSETRINQSKMDFTKEETAKSTEEEERNGIKKPKTRFLHFMRRKRRPTSSRVGETELNSSTAQTTSSADDLKTSSRVIEVSQSSSNTRSKSCMPTAFGRQLPFNSTYEEPRGESKEKEVSNNNKRCIPIKFQDNFPSVEKCTIPVVRAFAFFAGLCL
jgi:hypothetical protein